MYKHSEHIIYHTFQWFRTNERYFLICSSIFCFLGLASYLPALWIFPVKIKAIEIVSLYEPNYMINKSRSGSRAIHKSAILVSSRIIPTTKCNQNFNSKLFKICDLFVEICVNRNIRSIQLNEILNNKFSFILLYITFEINKSLHLFFKPVWYMWNKVLINLVSKNDLNRKSFNLS